MKIFSVQYGLRAVLLFCLFNAVFSVMTLAGEKEEYADRLIERARKEQLYKDPYWLLLLHYKRGLTGLRSLVDDPDFFLSPEGKRDPRREMEADIRAFFSEPSKDKMHPAIKFIARFSWLKEKLDIDHSLMAMDPMAKFEDYYRKIAPSRIIIVFPAGYMGSPASMYGHTLVILEPENGSRILSIAVNYAAVTGENFGPAFVFKGVFGMYDGSYSFLPYHKKINEYNNGEMRDMWEYRLNLNDSEMRRMVMHMIEMEKMKSEYYFFDENCSYNLLFLIEVARPSTRITDRFSIPVEPVDTIRAVLDCGLVEKRDYRPSLYSRMKYRKDVLRFECRKEAIAMAAGEDAGFSFRDREEEAMTCDLAIEYLQFLLVKNEISKEEYSRRFMALLKKRNALDYEGDTLKETGEPDPPESSHRSRKVSLSAGTCDNDRYLELRYHPSSQELIDVDRGLTPNSELVFLNTAIRYYPEMNRLYLQRFDAVSILSLPDSDSFYMHSCWKFRTGAEQAVMPDLDSGISGFINTAGGVSVKTGLPGQVYLMADLNFNFSPRFEYNTFNSIGASAGLITSYRYRWKSHIYGRSGWVLWGDTTFQWEAGAEEMFAFSNSFSLIFRFRRLHVFDEDLDEISLRASMFF